MASGPAKSAVAQPTDWQTVPADDWQDVSTGASAGTQSTATDTRNGVQREFDNLTQSQPVDVTHGWEKGLNSTVGNIGGGLMSLAAPLVHPIEAAKGLRDLMTPQNATEKGVSLLGPEAVPAMHMASGVLRDLVPQKSESAEPYMARIGGEALSGLGGLIGGAGAAEAAGGLADLIPSKARAGGVLQDIRNQAADTTVEPVNAWPEIERFKDLVSAGGKGQPVVSKLSKRLTDLVRKPQEGAFQFPEARDFYSNISDASHASTLSKLMGTAPKPTMLRQIGAIRKAFDDDLVNAAGKVGRADDYQTAMREYANAARLKKALIATGGLAAGATLGHSLPGKILSNFIPTQ